MKRIVCTLCGGSGIAYEVKDPAELRPKKPVAALEREYQLPLFSTPEEEEAWKALENSTKEALPPH